MDVRLDIYDRRQYNKKIVKDCEKIAESHHVSNGGLLMYQGLVERSDKLVLARSEKGNIIGFVALVKNYYGIDDLYVYQMAVSKECLKQGVGSKMLEFIKENIKGYKYLTADVRKINVASNNLFLKLGFDKKIRDARRESDFYVFDFKRNLNNTNRLAKR